MGKSADYASRPICKSASGEVQRSVLALPAAHCRSGTGDESTDYERERAQ